MAQNFVKWTRSEKEIRSSTITISTNSRINIDDDRNYDPRSIPITKVERQETLKRLGNDCNRGLVLLPDPGGCQAASPPHAWSLWNDEANKINIHVLQFLLVDRHIRIRYI
jgi:hypothetical protein